MKEVKPILFNTEMVRAILDGRKTVTRRSVKREIHIFQKNREMLVYDDRYLFDFALDAYIDSQARYKKDDILYVRETWSNYEGRTPYYLYKADYEDGQEGFWFEQEQENWIDLPKWKPSIHMPKEATRIFLRVTNVRIERLQDIRYYEIYQEGIPSNDICFEKCKENKLCVDIGSEGKCHAINAFKNLWNSTVNKNERLLYSWVANPYVFVYEFKCITKEEAMKESEER